MGEKYKLYLGDAIETIKKMVDNDEKVDMIFTSPPYFDFRKNYSGDDDDGRNRKDLLKAVHYIVLLMNSEDQK